MAKKNSERKATFTHDDLEEMREAIDAVREQWHTLRSIVSRLPQELRERARAYWLGYLEAILDEESGGTMPCTMEETYSDAEGWLDGGEDDDE